MPGINVKQENLPVLLFSSVHPVLGITFLLLEDLFSFVQEVLFSRSAFKHIAPMCLIAKHMPCSILPKQELSKACSLEAGWGERKSFNAVSCHWVLWDCSSAIRALLNSWKNMLPSPFFLILIFKIIENHYFWLMLWVVGTVYSLKAYGLPSIPWNILRESCSCRTVLSIGACMTIISNLCSISKSCVLVFSKSLTLDLCSFQAWSVLSSFSRWNEAKENRSWV